MDMEHLLSGITVAVRHHAIARLRHTEGLRYPLDGQPHRNNDFFHRIIPCRNMLSRDNQNMYRCLWMNIPKSHNNLILVDNISGNLSLGNLAKDTIIHIFSQIDSIAQKIFFCKFLCKVLLCFKATEGFFCLSKRKGHLQGDLCSPGRARTYGPLVNSQLLCLLSYRGVFL